jgi:hypothetical protein
MNDQSPLIKNGEKPHLYGNPQYNNDNACEITIDEKLVNQEVPMQPVLIPNNQPRKTHHHCTPFSVCVWFSIIVIFIIIIAAIASSAGYSVYPNNKGGNYNTSLDKDTKPYYNRP